MFTDIFLPEIHSLIADLYDVNTNCNFSDINTTLTYELLTHKVYNKLITEFDLLYDDILNKHSRNVALIYVCRLIQDLFQPLLNLFNEFPFLFNLQKIENVKDPYIIIIKFPKYIKSFIEDIKKDYNIKLVKNESFIMEYFQRLISNINDLRSLLNLTNPKGTA